MISSIGSNSNMMSAVQMRQNMFKKVDTNSDGKHDLDELKQMVANGPKGGLSAEEILTKFDTDKDGSISESEFNAADPASSGAMSGMQATSTSDFIAQLFGQTDENQDGSISQDELAQMVANGPENGSSTEDFLAMLDTNGDGSISKTEFTEGMKAHQPPQGPPPGSYSGASEETA